MMAGVTSHGLSCGVCKYKAHKSCVGNVLAVCKWSTRDTVEQRCISIENVSRNSEVESFGCMILVCFAVLLRKRAITSHLILA